MKTKRKPKLIPAIGGGKEDPPELLWRVLLFNAVTLPEIENAYAYGRAHPDEEAAPTDDVEALLRTPSPAAFLAGTFTEELHPREKGRFTFKDAVAAETKEPLAPKAMAYRLSKIATRENWGDAAPTSGATDAAFWGSTNPELFDKWDAAHEQSAATVGPDATFAAEQWSYGMGVSEWRAAYEDWRANGKLNTPEVEVDRRSEDVMRMDRGMATMFSAIDASKTNAELYRGTSVRSARLGEIENLKVGDTLPDGLASWSRATDVRDVFREIEVGTGYSVKAKVDMTLEPGAHGVDIATLGAKEYAWQEEVIVGGPLVVTSVEKVEADNATSVYHDIPTYKLGLKAAT